MPRSVSLSGKMGIAVRSTTIPTADKRKGVHPVGDEIAFEVRRRSEQKQDDVIEQREARSHDE